MASATKHIQDLFERDGPWCHVCGYEIRLRNPMICDPSVATRDHIVPKALGGRTTMSNLRLAHKYCNGFRALGLTTYIASPKYTRFIQSLVERGYQRNPNFTRNIEIKDCPERILPQKEAWSKTVFFNVGPLAFDIRFAPGRYSHLRVSLGSKHLTGAGYIKE